ncbi:hypothetical protein PAEPH01_0030 [Pancytospora epiphaga]|nr:hypothetical protein PAEPH01_0030 [Pancytospora epiphaga]
MQLAHMVVGQALVLMTVATVLKISESSKFTKLLNRFSELRSLRIADEKGVILFFLAVSYLILPVLQVLSSQAKISRHTTFYKRVKAAKASLFCNSMVLHAIFLSAYIFKALTSRVYNLIGLSFIFMFLSFISKLFCMTLLYNWGYFSFYICIFIVSMLVFVGNADFFYSVIVNSVPTTSFF